MRNEKGMKCPFLEAKVYMTSKGEMVKYYCKARGLYDLLDKKIVNSICLKGNFCIIREQVEKLMRENKKC